MPKLESKIPIYMLADEGRLSQQVANELAKHLDKSKQFNDDGIPYYALHIVTQEVKNTGLVITSVVYTRFIIRSESGDKTMSYEYQGQAVFAADDAKGAAKAVFNHFMAHLYPTIRRDYTKLCRHKPLLQLEGGPGKN